MFFIQGPLMLVIVSFSKGRVNSFPWLLTMVYDTKKVTHRWIRKYSLPILSGYEYTWKKSSDVKKKNFMQDISGTI